MKRTGKTPDPSGEDHAADIVDQIEANFVRKVFGQNSDHTHNFYSFAPFRRDFQFAMRFNA